MKKFVTAIVLALGFSGSVYAADFQPTKDRTTIIAEEIDDSGTTIAGRIETMSKTPGNIDLIISSPGGSVYYGLKITNAIRIAKHRGVAVRCAVVDIAASMAMLILDQCSERYILHDASVLWHDAATGTRERIRTDDAKGMAATLEQFEVYMQEMREHLRLDQATFDVYRRGEVLILAQQLIKLSPDYVVIIDDIKDTPNLFELKNPYKKPSFLGMFGL
jgi:ATP-dependent protease ClpP protease subunit